MPNANTSEAATKNNNAVALCVSAIVMDCIQYTLLSINWRASLVPAAAVIPAPRAYTNIVVVKKLVVEPRAQPGTVSPSSLLRKRG